MDISTKKWRVRDHSTMPGHYEVTNRHHVNTVKSAALERGEFPSFATMAAMSETQFDRLVAAVLKGAGYDH